MKKTVLITVDCRNSDDLRVVENFIETSCGRAKEVTSDNGIFKDGDLISGRDAWLASFEGRDVEFRLKGKGLEWLNFDDYNWDKEKLTRESYEFRIKPEKPVITMLNKDWSVTYSFANQEKRTEFMAKVEKFLNEH